MSTVLLQFTPQFDTPDVVLAPNESLTIVENSPPTTITPVITYNGSPVTPTSLAIVNAPTGGVAAVSGVSLLYTPNANYFGSDSFTYEAVYGGITSNVATVGVIVMPADCTELGRVTRSFVSGYTASRVETRRIRRFSKRCVVADFNGAMPAGVTITHVRWDCTSPWSIFMANPRVESSGRKVAIDASFNFAGSGGLLATATWSNGEITNAEFDFTVLDRPLYPGAVYDSANGPYVLEADA